MRHRQGFFWLKNWGFFRDPDRFLSELIETRGADDKVVSDEVVRVLRRERLRVALSWSAWWVRYAWARWRGLWARWKSPPVLVAPTVAELKGAKMATDPEAAGFTPEGKAALTKAKEVV